MLIMPILSLTTSQELLCESFGEDILKFLQGIVLNKMTIHINIIGEPMKYCIIFNLNVILIEFYPHFSLPPFLKTSKGIEMVDIKDWLGHQDRCVSE